MNQKTQFNRRHFLRATGITLGLPFFESLLPRGFAAPAPAANVKRLVAIGAPLGFHAPFLFPDASGFDYRPTPYLEPLQDHRDRFSIISGLMHPDVDGGHSAEASFLTGAAHPGRGSFRNTISLDQLAAEQIGHMTRFSSLTLSATHTASMSYSRSGVRIPPEADPAKIFAKLFIDGTAKEKEIQVERMRDGRSVMDLIMGEVKQVERKIGREDQDTLSQYLTSVRELETRLAEGEEWVSKPKPKVDFAAPGADMGRAGFTARMRMVYDLMFLALSTDSSRLITFMGSRGNDVPELDGVEEGRHNLSHHGLDPQKIEQLAIIELEEMVLFAEFLGKMKTLKENGVPLLDNTAVILGSSLGNASSHSNQDLPVVLAGGSFKHGQHLAFKSKDAQPLANLFVSCLQHLGLESDRFASGTGTLNGI